MKIERICCDGCKREYEIDQENRIPDFESFIQLGVYNKRSYDLCEDCQEKIAAFIDNEIIESDFTASFIVQA